MTEIRDVMALRSQILQRNTALRSATSLTPLDAAKADQFAARLERAIAGNPASRASAAGGGVEEPAPMGEMVRAIADKVNASQEREDMAAEAFERGETTDIAGVVLMAQRASIDFEATLQVRNKLLAAYKEIMNLQI